MPYANYSGAAGGMLTMTTQERNALQNPPTGMQIYNSTTNCLNYYNGTDWYETCGELVVNLPPVAPYDPFPPDESYDHPLELTLSWQCSDPDLDPLTYDLYMSRSGEPELVQSGITTNSYFVSDLYHTSFYQWKVVAHDGHGNATESPVWNFETVYCGLVIIDAGPDMTTCEGNEVDISEALIPLDCTCLWSTSGDGTFDDPTQVTPTYYTGPGETGTIVTLTLTTVDCGICPAGGSDEMELFVQPNPIVDAGPDQSVCEGVDVQLNADAINFDYVQWGTINGSGYFSHELIFSPVYYPSFLDYVVGSTDLIIIANPVSPCVMSDIDTITYFPPPETDAG